MAEAKPVPEPHKSQKPLPQLRTDAEFDQYKWSFTDRSECVLLRCTGAPSDPPPAWPQELGDDLIRLWTIRQPDFKLVTRSITNAEAERIERQAAVNADFATATGAPGPRTLFPISHQAEAVTADNVKVLLVPQIRMPRMPVNLLQDIIRTIVVSDGESAFVPAGLYSQHAADCDPNCLLSAHVLHREHLKSIAGTDLYWHQKYIRLPDMPEGRDVGRYSLKIGWEQPKQMLYGNGFDFPGISGPGFWHLDLITVPAFQALAEIHKRELAAGSAGQKKTPTSWIDMRLVNQYQFAPDVPIDPVLGEQIKDMDRADFVVMYTPPVYPIKDMENAQKAEAAAAAAGSDSASDVNSDSPASPQSPDSDNGTLSLTGSLDKTTCAASAMSESPVTGRAVAGRRRFGPLIERKGQRKPHFTFSPGYQPEIIRRHERRSGQNAGPFSTPSMLNFTPPNALRGRDKPNTRPDLRQLHPYAVPQRHDIRPEFRWSFEVCKRLNKAERAKRTDNATHVLICLRPYADYTDMKVKHVQLITAVAQKRIFQLMSLMDRGTLAAGRELRKRKMVPLFLPFPAPYRPDPVLYRSYQHNCARVIFTLIRQWSNGLELIADRFEQSRYGRQLLVELYYNVLLPGMSLNPDFPVAHEDPNKQLLPRPGLSLDDCVQVAAASTEITGEPGQPYPYAEVQKKVTAMLMDKKWTHVVHFLYPEDMIPSLPETVAKELLTDADAQLQLMQLQELDIPVAPNDQHPANAAQYSELPDSDDEDIPPL
jgi:hypothetical protein